MLLKETAMLWIIEFPVGFFPLFQMTEWVKSGSLRGKKQLCGSLGDWFNIV